MELILLRHGKAPSAMESGVATDAERPLSEAGRQQALRAGRALKAMGRTPARILHSPLLRAKQTAEGACEGLGGGAVQVFPPLEAGAVPDELLGALSPHASEPRLLLVGHQPDLGALAAAMLFGSPSGALELKPGGMVLLEASRLQARGEARLISLLRPEQIERLA